jgi:hypothetical protein
MMLVAALLTLAFLLAVSDDAVAATLCVNPGGTGGCFASIQAAVDASSNGDTITIEAGTYAEDVEIEERELAISGAGQEITIIEGSVVTGAGARIALSDLTVTMGGPPFGFALIYIQGPRSRVTLTRITARDYTSVTGNGIATGSGTKVEIRESTVSGNRSGVIIVGKGTIVDSEIRDNGPGAGSGISIQTRGFLRLLRSTVAGNHTEESGGGIDISGGRLIAEDSTISGNTAETSGAHSFGGGGIQVSTSARAKISRCTITQNSAIGFGDGIYVEDGGVVDLASTIVAQNGTQNCAAQGDVLGGGRSPGSVRSKGYNLFETPCERVEGTEPFPPLRPTDLVGVDPLLGPLASNGGPTRTHELLPGSPAIEVIPSPRACRPADQRGVSRSPEPCDIGAYEAP